MLQNIENLNVVANLDKYLNANNHFAISPYCLIRDKNNTIEYLKKANKKIYFKPHLVIVINFTIYLRNFLKPTINTIISFLLDEKLKVYLMESQSRDKLYILLDISEEDFRVEAEKYELKFKLLDFNMQKVFVNQNEFICTIEPFYSRHYQQIIYQKISTVLDLNILKAQNIVQNIFFTHKENSVLRLEKTFLSKEGYLPSPFKLFNKMFFGGNKIIYSEIDCINRYFGEKLAIYYSFHTFLSNELLLIGFLGLIWASIYNFKIFTSKLLFPIWGLIFSIWITIMITKWKRKNREIIHKWGITDVSDVRTQRAEYLGDEYYSELNSKLEKHTISNKNVLIFINLANILVDFHSYYYRTFNQCYINISVS